MCKAAYFYSKFSNKYYYLCYIIIFWINHWSNYFMDPIVLKIKRYCSSWNHKYTHFISPNKIFYFYIPLKSWQQILSVSMLSHYSFCKNTQVTWSIWTTFVNVWKIIFINFRCINPFYFLFHLFYQV